MFPIRDHNRPSSFAFINFLIIALTSFVFYLQVTAPDFEGFISGFALIPSRVDLSDPFTLLPFLYSIFMHGGWFHIISNLWFLAIFGDNVEDYLGHVRYLIFYLFCGISAGAVQYMFSAGSDIPTLGASGAIAGVMGAYIFLFPDHKIETLVFTFGGFLQRIYLPASFMLGYWFLTQFLSGVGSIGFEGGGVAWWAHIGGFAAGWLVLKIFIR